MSRALNLVSWARRRGSMIIINLSNRDRLLGFWHMSSAHRRRRRRRRHLPFNDIVFLNSDVYESISIYRFNDTNQHTLQHKLTIGTIQWCLIYQSTYQTPLTMDFIYCYSQERKLQSTYTFGSPCLFISIIHTKKKNIS